jgi:hypothetical protein
LLVKVSAVFEPLFLSLLSDGGEFVAKGEWQSRLASLFVAMGLKIA